MPAADPRVRAARTIAVDVAAARVVVALHAAGVRPILLKGPALARLLYGAGELRSYVDVDLLVAPADEPLAEDVLRADGYGILVADSRLAGHRPLHAHEWTKECAPSVDLHRTLPGASAPPSDVFGAIAARSQTIRIAGAEVETPDEAGLALHVALHAAHHGLGAPKVLDDLRRAVERVSERDWRDASGLAGRIGASGALAAGLRLTAEGADLARRLGLPAGAPVHVALRAAGAPPLAAGLDWFVRTPGLAAKARLAASTALPAPGAMRLWRPLARRGRRGLVAAYVTHPFWLARHAVPSARALRRARRG
jgi:hypothetical protein